MTDLLDDDDSGLDKVRSEVAGGLRYAHTRANANTGKLLEIASFAYAVIELLAEKGLLETTELDERKKAIAGRLVPKFIDEGMGLTYQEREQDKYTLQLHKVPRGSSRKGIEDRVAASLWRCAGHHHR
jgi:hypothetical protein